jgi:hypothetical protein
LCPVIRQSKRMLREDVNVIEERKARQERERRRRQVTQEILADKRQQRRDTEATMIHQELPHYPRRYEEGRRRRQEKEEEEDRTARGEKGLNKGSKTLKWNRQWVTDTTTVILALLVFGWVMRGADTQSGQRRETGAKAAANKKTNSWWTEEERARLGEDQGEEEEYAPGSPLRKKRGAALSNLEKYFKAYDCTIPTNLTTTTLGKRPDCRRPPVVAKKIERQYLLLQTAAYTRVTIHTCQAYANRISYICGGAGHSAINPEDWYFGRPVDISAENCRSAWDTGKYRLHYNKGKTMGITINGTTFKSVFLAGKAYTDGNDVHCTGEFANFTKVMHSKNDIYTGAESMVVTLHYRLTTQTLTGMIDEAGRVTIEEDQVHLPCPVSELGCAMSNQEKTYTWKKPTAQESCPYYKTRMVKGIDVLDKEGHTLFMSQDESMIRLLKGTPMSKCGGIIYSTDYDNLFLTEDLFHAQFTRGIHPAEMSILTYANQQDAYLFGRIEDNIQREAISVNEHQCEKERRRRNQEYARQAAEQHVIQDGETAQLNDGQFVTAAGEVWYRYGCQEVVVRSRDTTSCYNALPVAMSKEGLFTYLMHHGVIEEEATEIASAGGLAEGSDRLEELPGGGNEFFLEPRSRRLVTTASVEVCAPPFTTMYQNTRGRWIAHEGERISMASEPLLLDISDLPVEREEGHVHLDFADGGIYDSEAVKRMDKFSQAPRAVQGVASKLAAQQAGGRRPSDPIHASSLFADLPSLNIKALDMFSWFWTMLEKYGQICSIIVATGLFIKLMGWVIGLVMRLYSAPTHPNVLVHILTAFFPALREYFRSHKDPDQTYPAFSCSGCCMPRLGERRQQEEVPPGPIIRRNRRFGPDQQEPRERPPGYVTLPRPVPPRDLDQQMARREQQREDIRAQGMRRFAADKRRASPTQVAPGGESVASFPRTGGANRYDTEEEEAARDAAPSNTTAPDKGFGLSNAPT